MTRSSRFSYLLTFALLATSVVETNAEDWLRFRGPNGDGFLANSSPGPITWNESSNVKWKVDLPGPGSSSPIVVGRRVFVTCWSGYGVDRETPGDQSQLTRHLLCLDRETGKILWNKTVSAYLPEDEYGGMFAEHGYASHTPVSDGEFVYAFFGKSGVVKFDMDGNQLWSQSVGTESGANNWGSASSPILYEDLLIVPATAESEAMVALNTETGEEAWRQEASGFSGVWGTPVLVPVSEGRTDLVIAVPNEIWGFDPSNGKLVWFCTAKPNNSFCSSVIADDGVIYAIESGPGGGGGVAVRAGGTGDVTDTHIVWSGRQRNRIGTPVFHEGRIYTFGNGIASCVDSETGEQVYRARLKSTQGREGGGRRAQDYASPVIAGGVIYFPSRSGSVYLVQASEDFLQLGVNQVTSETEDFSASPAICDGQLFLRSNKSLYCVADDGDVSGELQDAVAVAEETARNAPAEEAVEENDRAGGRRGGRRFDPEAFFRRQDTDGDGKLVGDEISDRLRDSLDQVDTDGDGAVTQEEFRSGMRQMFQGGGRRGRRGGESNPKPKRPQRPPLSD